MSLSASPAQPAVAPGDFPARRARLVVFLLALITLVVYLPAGSYDFVLYDDPGYVSDNPMVKNGLSWAGLKWAFIGWHASNWHPLTWLSLQLDCQLFGLNPGAHHLVNVLFHAANAVLLFQIWLRLTKALWPSAMVAALFAWHPLHVESVAWIAERKDVLSTFFGLLAMLAYARFAEPSAAPDSNPATPVRGPGIWLGASLGMFALALLAKPMLVTLPFLLLLLDYWPLRRFTAESDWLAHWWALAWEKWPYFVIALASCVCTFLAQRQEAVMPLQYLSAGARLENATVACVRYVGATLWPVNLCVFYPLPQHFSAGGVIAAAGLLLAISALAWRYRRHRYFVTGWLWFLGMLVPVIGLVQVGNQARADRYTYLPVVGLFAAACFALAEARAWRKIPAWPLGLAAVCILTACVAATERQLSFWRNTETLFTHALAVTTDNGNAHMLLALFYKDQGRARECDQEYQAGMACFSRVMVRGEGGRKRPLAAVIELRFGQDAELAGNKRTALAHYREALRWDPYFPEAHNERGFLLEDAGKTDDALAEYEAVARLRPESADAHENLGTQLAKMGRFDEALREYQAAVQLAPADSQAMYLLGRTQLRLGRTAEAITAFRAALALNPSDGATLVYLARVLASDESPQLRNGAEALALATKANQLTGGTQAFVLGTLAMACAETGQFAAARQAVQTAISMDTPGGQETVSNLQAQLKCYAAGQPFRESFASPHNPPNHPF